MNASNQEDANARPHPDSTLDRIPDNSYVQGPEAVGLFAPKLNTLWYSLDSVELFIHKHILYGKSSIFPALLYGFSHSLGIFSAVVFVKVRRFDVGGRRGIWIVE